MHSAASQFKKSILNSFFRLQARRGTPFAGPFSCHPVPSKYTLDYEVYLSHMLWSPKVIDQFIQGIER